MCQSPIRIAGSRTRDSPSHTCLDQREQTLYARAYLDSISGRARIRERIRRNSSPSKPMTHSQKAGNRYFFRKRLPDQEQPCIYMRDGADGEDQLFD